MCAVEYIHSLLKYFQEISMAKYVYFLNIISEIPIKFHSYLYKYKNSYINV